MIQLTDKGLYCEPGGFYIDPTRGVEVALITHAHSDHARKGSRQYVCVDLGAALLRHRLGANVNLREVPYRESFTLGETLVSFHPAGHILGSAQIRIEHKGEVWVVSGDYKRDPDPTCEAFEVVTCDTFITEATFGEPRYHWKNTGTETGRQILDWWEENRRAGRNSLLFAYALGKTQRVLAELAAHTERPVYLFGEASPLTACYRAVGVRMVPTKRLEEVAHSDSLRGELIVAPHSIRYSYRLARLGEGLSTAFASGWMQTGAWGMRDRYERGFVLSDHADWPGLLRTVQESGASRVFVLHGSEGALVKHLRGQGLKAAPMIKPLDAGPRMKRGVAQGELFT